MYACPAGESFEQRIHANIQRLFLLAVKRRDYGTLDPGSSLVSGPTISVGQRLTRRPTTDFSVNWPDLTFGYMLLDNEFS